MTHALHQSLGRLAASALREAVRASGSTSSDLPEARKLFNLLRAGAAGEAQAALLVDECAGHATARADATESVPRADLDRLGVALTRVQEGDTRAIAQSLEVLQTIATRMYWAEVESDAHEWRSRYDVLDE